MVKEKVEKPVVEEKPVEEKKSKGALHEVKGGDKVVKAYGLEEVNVRVQQMLMEYDKVVVSGPRKNCTYIKEGDKVRKVLA